MTQTIDRTQECPLLELNDEFPETGFVCHDKKSGRYACFCYTGVHGVAYFEHKTNAELLAKSLEQAYTEKGDPTLFSIESVSFDEAREIAKNRPAPVVALMLLDNLARPIIHFVK